MRAATRMACFMLRASARFLPRDIERRSVIHRGAGDREAERDVDGTFEVDQLHRDVALIVVHGDHQVVGAPYREQEDCVRGMRAAAIDTTRTCAYRKSRTE
jgi:hypothetical protein